MKIVINVNLGNDIININGWCVVEYWIFRIGSCDKQMFYRNFE